MPTTCNSNSPILHHLRNPTYSSISIMGWCKDTHKYVPFCISEVIVPSSLATHSLNILTWNRFWYCQFHGGCNYGNFVCMLGTMCDVNCIIVTKNTTIQLMFSGHELYWVIIFFRWCVRDVSFFCCDCDYYHYHNTTHILLKWIVWSDSAIPHIVRMCHFINMVR